jgi:hypothetical protein
MRYIRGISETHRKAESVMPNKEKFLFERKLIQFHTSLAVILPRPWIEERGLSKGSVVRVTYAEGDDFIVISPKRQKAKGTNKTGHVGENRPGRPSA